MDSESRLNPQLLWSASPTDIETGSRSEGFCIPQVFLARSDVDPFGESPMEKEYWQPDRDQMTVKDASFQNEAKQVVPMFTVEHATDDPRYAKLRLTNDWKEDRPRYKNTTYLNHAFILPLDRKFEQERQKSTEEEQWSYDMHGPVRKLYHKRGPLIFEKDETTVFKYPTAWPEPAMEWLIRPRSNGWPSPELVQEIFEASCHLAPVGRGKRAYEPLDVLEYVKNPEGAESACALQVIHSDQGTPMDQTEWRLSFSVAENKLGQSVSPVQRHVLVLLKTIKKLYFPEVVFSYYLKNLLFWECETREESFWREESSARCLLSLLDRLKERLETGVLPHYIIPQSNLLQNEDPDKLAEAAAVVDDTRRHILPKTVSLLKRLHSLTYQSQIFLKDLRFEPDILKIQDKALSEDEVGMTLISLYLRFSGKCKDVIVGLQRQQNTDEDVQMMMQVPVCAYRSLLARNFCKLFYLKNVDGNTRHTNEEDFISLIKEEVGAIPYFDDEFNALALVFFTQTLENKEMSLLVPRTSAMQQIKETQKVLAQKQMNDACAPVMGGFDRLQRGDLAGIEEKLTKELKGCLDSITLEDVEKKIFEEIGALLNKGMKLKKNR